MKCEGINLIIRCFGVAYSNISTIRYLFSVPCCRVCAWTPPASQAWNAAKDPRTKWKTLHSGYALGIWSGSVWRYGKVAPWCNNVSIENGVVVFFTFRRMNVWLQMGFDFCLAWLQLPVVGFCCAALCSLFKAPLPYEWKHPQSL